MTDRQLILGVDGGGSKTAARIARIDGDGGIDELGEGFGGPSNIRAVGQAHAEINLDVAVDAAHRAADTAQTEIDYAVLALAGSSLPDVQSFIASWARRRSLAKKVDIVHDADPVLAVGAPDGHGIALIVGTGSVAVGLGEDGERSVAGGWGHWFGDTGSGYDLGRQALASVADATDGIGPETTLVERILERLHTDKPREMLQKLGQAPDVRREIASLAPVLLQAAADGDQVALAIIEQAAEATARLVQVTVAKLGFDNDVRLAVAGGIVTGNKIYRDLLIRCLSELGTKPASIVVVGQPVEGSLIMARQRLIDDKGNK